MGPLLNPTHHCSLLLLVCTLMDVTPASSSDASSIFEQSLCGDNLLSSSPPSAIMPSPHRCQWGLSSSATATLNRKTHARTIAFQHLSVNSFPQGSFVQSKRKIPRSNTALFNGIDGDDTSKTSSSSSFLSTSKANVSFFNNNNNNNGKSPSNLSAIDRILLNLTSDRTSLLLGSIGILLLLLNRFVSFPEDTDYEASRSRIDLLGVFAAGSVLLNGITKLDVESVVAERVVLEGVNEDKVTWHGVSGNKKGSTSTTTGDYDDKFQSTVEWALSSFLKCSPARTAVLLTSNPNENERWVPLATIGILPSEPRLRSSIPDSVANTPILDRMLREDGSIKGGTVGGTEVAGATVRKGPKESYLPTLQALPGRVEFTYLPPNAQEVLLLPVTRPEGMSGDDGDGRYYAVVLGGDTAKSFAPRDIAWCKEIASWIGDLV